ncbi:bis(5'-nucleosyl)-tetraphosphatase (symmetrical) YqeK [Mycoplasmatota bacterium WC30]
MIDETLIKSIEIYLEKTFVNHKSRLRHIYNVKKVAITLGNIYSVDIPSVIVASYLHDATKINSDEENTALASKLIYEGIPSACVHAFSAAILAKERFGITDIDILNSIKYHCSGRKNMSLLEKIIYVSDFIEDGRDFVSDELRAIAKTNIDKAVYLIMIQTKNYILKNKQKFSSKTEEAISYYQKKLEEFND